MSGILIVLLSLAMVLWCNGTDGNVIRHMKAPKIGECKPHSIYVSWHRVRHSLNERYKMNISDTIEGPPMLVQKCRQYLSPCKKVKTFCGKDKEHTVKAIFFLKGDGVVRNKLMVEFYEDKTCHCVEEKIYDYFLDVSAVPLIYHTEYLED